MFKLITEMWTLHVYTWMLMSVTVFYTIKAWVLWFLENLPQHINDVIDFNILYLSKAFKSVATCSVHARIIHQTEAFLSSYNQCDSNFYRTYQSRQGTPKLLL